MHFTPGAPRILRISDSLGTIPLPETENTAHRVPPDLLLYYTLIFEFFRES